MEIALRATFMFAFVFLLTRGMKKRTLGDLAPFELIFLIVVGDLVQTGVTQEDYSVTGSVLALSTFGFWATVLTWLSWRSDRARRLIEGVPLVLVSDGQPIQEALDLEQMPVAEVLEAARQAGLATLDDVRYAVLEPSGRISIIKREP
jgi:uncharacterized membrane protein YcaP (DUF421 family)